MEGFYISKIDNDIFSKIDGKSYKKDCIVPVEELRYLHLLHKDLSGKTLEGEMICNIKIADLLIDIFQKLFAASYPIEKIHLIDEYDADDELSMRDNNSSCFNFRLVSNTNRISKHGYGLAVDINPRYNPYIKFINGKKSIEPANSLEFEDRTKNFSYKIEENDLCCQLFLENGFLWGGNCWAEEKDYQHFFLPDGYYEKGELR